jgi:exodeoxyribonuclease VII large subunit
VSEAEKTYSVSSLNRAIANLFARETPSEGFWVRGEVCRLKAGRGGHYYFELAEREPSAGRAAGPKAVIPAVMWSSRRTVVERALAAVGAEFAEDLGVRVRVRVVFYEAQGRVQVEVLDIDPTFTAGDMAMARDAARRALAAAGLLEANRALRVPLVPLRIALVTSGGSAAYHDFTHELESSGFRFSVELCDTRVSGPGAAAAVAAAMRRASTRTDVDLVVLIRGGGSRTDLAVFDAEAVARSVAAAALPVWVGVGHEIDTSLCDEVANRSFKTPTAVGQALVGAVASFAADLDETHARLRSAVGVRLKAAAEDLATPALRLSGSARHRLAVAEGRLAVARTRITTGTSGMLTRETGALERAVTRIRSGPGRVIRDRDARLDGIAGQVRALDPARVLQRGFSVTRDASGAVVRDATTLQAGERLTTELATGSVTSVVEDER